jgi:hypothetical protein
MIVPSIRKLAVELGISHTMLNRQLAKGKFQKETDGSFDVEKVRVALANNADISQPSQRKNKNADPARSKEPEAAPENLNGGNAYDLFNRARAVKEMAIAKEKQLDLKERQEELLDANEVERVWTEGMTAFNNRLLLISDKLAPKVAVCNNVLECRVMIETEIRETIRALSEMANNAS